MPFQLPTCEEKAVYVQQQFDRIARGYDLTNDAISMGMHRSWKARALDELVGATSGSYLDVCCGTGDLALALAARLTPKGRVTALDFSRNMLAVAGRREIKERSHNAFSCHMGWVQGDAQHLPFDGSLFDGAVISFGLRNLTDLQAGLNEMARVVRRGGRVVNLDLGHSTTPLFAPAFKMYFRHVVPLIGQLLQNDRSAYTYLPESLNTYPTPEKLTHMFEQARLVDVRHIPLALGTVALHVGTVSR
jgi:demethylmenaquinone methyltransferase/2-methoxy-6-polyprenyl-1,4-benzoquinol methylase